MSKFALQNNQVVRYLEMPRQILRQSKNMHILYMWMSNKYYNRWYILTTYINISSWHTTVLGARKTRSAHIQYIYCYIGYAVCPSMSMCASPTNTAKTNSVRVHARNSKNHTGHLNCQCCLNMLKLIAENRSFTPGSCFGVGCCGNLHDCSRARSAAMWGTSSGRTCWSSCWSSQARLTLTELSASEGLTKLF